MIEKKGQNILAEFQSLSVLIKELADEGDETAALLLEEFNACGASLVNYVLECSSEIGKLNTQKEETKEELQKLNAKLEALEKSVPKADFEHYSKVAEKKYSKYWNIMEEKSKTFIATAMYVFNLMKAYSGDFSPVVLEFSKALEEELKEKIFFKFITEQSKKPLRLDKGRIIEAIRTYKNDKIYFIEYSMMLKTFRKPRFVDNSYWVLLHQTLQAKGWRMDILTNPAFIDDGVNFVETFRNRAAHANTFTQQEAVVCSEKTKELTYTFLSAYPQK